MSLPAGTQLGPYEILDLIGSGGMGNVYRAHDPKLGRDVAIKVLPPGFAMDERRLKRFQREARILASLSHPNLVQVFDAGEEDGHPYLVMELLSGETLRNRLARGRLPWRKAAELVAAVADGLAAAHARGIVHRDLKPENLFLTQTGHVKILDFGIATPQRYDLGDSTTVQAGESTRTQEGLLLGTVGYMSPEQIRGEPLDGRSDLFSLGVILWEALNGQRPFRGPTSVEVLSAILKEEPPPMDPAAHVHPALERVLDACLAKDPQGRFHSAHDLAFALQSLSQWTGTSSERLPGSPGKRSRSRRLSWAVMAVPIAAMVFLGGYVAKTPKGPAKFRQLTFQKGEIGSARFSPDGLEVIYDIAQGGSAPRLFSVRIESLEDAPAGETPAKLLGISGKGEWAVQLEPRRDLDSLDICRGTLALAVNRGAAPREMIQDVVSADLSPSGDLAVVRCIQGHYRLECPAGRVRAERGTHLSNPRFSRDGRYLAFLECAEQDTNQARTSIQVLDLETSRTQALPGLGRFSGLAWRDGEIITARGTGRGSSEIHSISVKGRDHALIEMPGIWFVQDADTKGRLLLMEIRTATSIRVWRSDLLPQDYSLRVGDNLFGLSPDGRKILIQSTHGLQHGSQDSVLISRPVDGGLPTYLGRGSVGSLSPDGAWLAVVEPGPKVAIGLLSTGAKGESRQLEVQALEGVTELQWTPDGQGLFANGNAKGRPPRIWFVDLRDGSVRPLTPEGVAPSADWTRPSPDGRYLVAEEDHNAVLADLQNPAEAPHPISGLAPGELTAGWSRDSRRVYAWKPGPLPLQITSLDVRTGHRAYLKTLDSNEEPGQILTNPFVSTDGKVVAGNLVSLSGSLFLVEGLK